MNLGIVGSRTFNDYSMLDKIIKKHFILWDIFNIVSGCSEYDDVFRGADTLGRDFAKNNNINYIGFPPDWNKYGKKAGILRNSDIVNNSTSLVAFWDGTSKGTKDSINKAFKQNKNVLIVNYIDKKIYNMKEEV